MSDDVGNWMRGNGEQQETRNITESTAPIIHNNSSNITKHTATTSGMYDIEVNESIASTATGTYSENGTFI